MKQIFVFITALFLLQCSNSGAPKSTAAKDSCCVKNNSKTDSTEAILSEITCPKCAYKKMETMPTDICLIKYTCENCQAVLFPKAGDCCVFCTYGTHKCPSKQ